MRENKKEIDVLYQDLLIPVTSFFRDPKSFETVCETIFPAIIKNRKESDPIRIWVAGCSTGQEVYSMAICLKEFLVNRSEKVQLFATDISEPAIVKARTGVYGKSELENISPQRLREFFTRINDGYRVNNSIRDICVFARHDFLKDPPFGKLDMISCRNTLIYLEPYLQKKALTTFHYALNNQGFLWLGKSETISSVPELFGIARKGDKIFTRKNVSAKYMLPAIDRSEQTIADTTNKGNADRSGRTDFQKTADDIMLSKYTPAGVVVNEAMDIVHFRGKTMNYLEQADGKPTHNLLKMAKEGLSFELRNILHKAKKEKKAVTKKNIEINDNGHIRMIALEAMPLPDTLEPHYMVLFHENGMNESSNGKGETENEGSVSLDKNGAHPSAEQITRLTAQVSLLKRELSQLREDMRSITEDQEAVNEELQSANEELLSSSEELQSLNEELETGKEELQSTNEELTVVNQELIGLNIQVSEARNYAETIIATLREPLLVLDKYLRIISGNKSFYDTFRVTENDTEGKLIYHLGNEQWNSDELRILLENILPKKQSFTDFEVNFNFLHIGVHTMLLNGTEIIRERGADNLILISFEDITERLKFQQNERRLLSRFKNLVAHAPVAIMILRGSHYEVELANDNYFALVDKEKEWIGEPLSRSLPEPQWQEMKPLLDEVMQTGTAYHSNEQKVILRRDHTDQKHFFNFMYEPIREADGMISGVMVVGNDVTEQVLARRKLEESERHFRLMADLMPSKISNALPNGEVTYLNQNWLDFSGYNFKELKDFGYHKMMHPDELEEFQKRLQKASETGAVLEMEMRFLNKEGEYKWHLNLAAPIQDESGNTKMWVGVTTEIQHQKEQREVLELAVLERTNELQESNEQLRRSNEDLQRFAHVASHDLREPLRKITTFANRLRDDAETILSEKGSVYLSKVRNAADRMDEMVQGVLNYSMITASEKIDEEVDLNEVMRNIEADLEVMIQQKDATISYGALPQIVGAPVLLYQLLYNLIYNSLKFSKRGKKQFISIRSGIIQSGLADYAEIVIQDEGIGFEADQSEGIFIAFARLNSKDEYGGTGLGLSLCKKIVERHGGTITAEGIENKGAVFTLTLPLKRPL